MDDKKLIGYKDGMGVYVSDTLLAQKGEREVRRQLGLIRRYPVKTDLSGNVVMVEGDSHEDAVQRYLSRTIKVPNEAGLLSPTCDVVSIVHKDRRCAAQPAQGSEV